MSYFVTLTSRYQKMRKSILNKIFLFFLIPIGCVLLSTAFIYNYYQNYFEEEIKANYRNTINNVADTIDNLYYEIFKTNTLLSIDSNLTDIITSNQPIGRNDFDKVINSVQSLQKFRTTKNIIDNAFIIDKIDNLVISSNGTMSIDLFFNKSYKYEQYPESFWMDLYLRSNDFRVLMPSLMTNILTEDKGKNIIPIIQPGIGTFVSKKLFVVNLNEAVLHEMLDSFRLSDNSVLLISNMNGNLLSRTNTKDERFNSAIKPVIIYMLEEGKETSIEVINRNKMLIILHKTDVLSNKFVYAACIPLTDIYQKTVYIKNLAYGTILVTLVLTILISYIMAHKIYSPIKNLVNIMKLKTNSSTQTVNAKSEFDYLNDGIQQMIDNNENLSRDLTSALPAVMEQYLLKIMNNNEFLSDEEACRIFEKGGINFPYLFYCVAVVDFNYSKEFYNNFSKEEQILVNKGTEKLLTCTLPNECKSYILKSERDKLYIIINMPKTVTKQNIKAAIKSFSELYTYDSSYLQIYAGIGGIYEQIAGINPSYNEAVQALTATTPFSHDKIKTYSLEKNESNIQYHFNDENKLYNYLLGGYKQEAMDLVKSIVENNISCTISDESMKELYICIYTTGLRTLKFRDQVPQDLMGIYYMDIETVYVHTPVREIATYILEFFNRILSFNGGNSTSVDINSIKAYIDENYTMDLYLDYIAEKHHISSAHLSRLMKNAMGMSFQQYLSNVRIAKAKDLLHKSRKPINEIGEEVGFNSRNTFIRMFKKLEGITPSEYRKLLKGIRS